MELLSVLPPEHSDRAKELRRLFGVMSECREEFQTRSQMLVERVRIKRKLYGYLLSIELPTRKVYALELPLFTSVTSEGIKNRIPPKTKVPFHSEMDDSEAKEAIEVMNYERRFVEAKCEFMSKKRFIDAFLRTKTAIWDRKVELDFFDEFVLVEKDAGRS